MKRYQLRFVRLQNRVRNFSLYYQLSVKILRCTKYSLCSQYLDSNYYVHTLLHLTAGVAKLAKLFKCSLLDTTYAINPVPERSYRFNMARGPSDQCKTCRPRNGPRQAYFYRGKVEAESVKIVGARVTRRININLKA